MKYNLVVAGGGLSSVAATVSAARESRDCYRSSYE